MFCTSCYQQVHWKSQRRLLKSLFVEATSAISDARRMLEWQRSLQLFATYIEGSNGSSVDRDAYCKRSRRDLSQMVHLGGFEQRLAG